MEYLPEQDSDGSYTNEDERNVHVWCSIMKPCTSVRPDLLNQPTLGLVAGCYVHDTGLPSSVFYYWLHRIITPDRPQGQEIILLRCPSDPRKTVLPLGPIDFRSHLGPLTKSTISVPEGHYMIYLYDRNSHRNIYYPFWPTLVPAVFKRRSRSPSQTCTPSPSGAGTRNTGTRIDVRMRDRRCLITGQAAVKRKRGGNFTGLEVAHIYPLMAVGLTDWLDTLPSQTARNRVATRQLADSSYNAILLRADIHSLFDDYQWSIWSDPVSGKHTILRFEKSGATVLKFYSINPDIRPSTLNASAPSDLDLLRGHLHVALLIHVRGVGTRAINGFRRTLL